MGSRDPGTGTSSAAGVFAAATVVVVILVGLLAYQYLGGAGAPTGTGTETNTSAPAAAPILSYSADAYAVETSALLNGFSSSTGVPVAPVKSGGSFADANEIAAGAPDDVFVSVALSATDSAHLLSRSPDWAVGFASDQIVLAYVNGTSAESVASLGVAAAKSNSTSDWNDFFTSLTSGRVKVGIGDPAEDPAGLRGWLALEAAGYLYDNGSQGAYAGALARAGANVTGANAAALVAPLESGQIQFLFIYRSAAMADRLSFIQLDSHINFGDPALGAFYGRFSYADAAGVTVGAPIILCVTVPLGSSDSQAALEFVQYVVRNVGTLASYGLHPFGPPLLYNDTAPPAPISALVSQGLVAEGGSLP